MDEFHVEHSRIWQLRERADSAKLEPEAIILAVAWILAVVQIGVTVVRGEAFGPDRAIAVAFAIAYPLLAAPGVLELAKRLVSRLRHR